MYRRAYASMYSGLLRSCFSNLRPICEFLDVKRAKKPANFAQLLSRVNANLEYFSSNYAVVFIILCTYSLLTNVWLLFDFIFFVASMYLIGKLDGGDFEISQQRFSTGQLYTCLYVIAPPIALISGVFGAIMWLIGASGVVLLGHAALIGEDFSRKDGEDHKSDRRPE